MVGKTEFRRFPVGSLRRNPSLSGSPRQSGHRESAVNGNGAADLDIERFGALCQAVQAHGHRACDLNPLNDLELAHVPQEHSLRRDSSPYRTTAPAAQGALGAQEAPSQEAQDRTKSSSQKPRLPLLLPAPRTALGKWLSQ